MKHTSGCPRVLLGVTLALVSACASTGRVESVGAEATSVGPELLEPPTPQHRWLQRLVGDWTVVYEGSVPGGGSFQFEVSETVRSLGGHWIVSEGSGDGGFRSLLTLGFDPQPGTFVGTWVDTNQTRVWLFEGELDGSQAVLRLHAEGPSVVDPSTTAQYRETIELLDSDHKRVTSEMLQPDGTWSKFLSASGRRRS